METQDLPALAPPESKTWRVRVEDGMVTSFAPVRRRIHGGEYFTGSVMELAQRYYTQMTPEGVGLLAREICKAIAALDQSEAHDEAHKLFNKWMSRWSNHFPANNQTQQRERNLAYSVRAIIDCTTHQDWKRPTVAQIIEQYAKDHADANNPKLRTISRDTVERTFKKWAAMGIVQIDHARTRAEDDREYGDSWRRNRYDWNLALVPASGGPEAHYLTSQEHNVAALYAALSAVLSAALFAALTVPTVPPARAANSVSGIEEGISTKITNDFIGGHELDSLRGNGEQQEGSPAARDDEELEGWTPGRSLDTFNPLELLDSGTSTGIPAGLEDTPSEEIPAKRSDTPVGSTAEDRLARQFKKDLARLAWLWWDGPFNTQRVSLLRNKDGSLRRQNTDARKLVLLTGDEKSALVTTKRDKGQEAHVRMIRGLHTKYLADDVPDYEEAYGHLLPVDDESWKTGDFNNEVAIGRNQRGVYVNLVRARPENTDLPTDRVRVVLEPDEAALLLTLKNGAKRVDHPDYRKWQEHKDGLWEKYVAEDNDNVIWRSA